jgi:hypothetical protein
MREKAAVTGMIRIRLFAEVLVLRAASIVCIVFKSTAVFFLRAELPPGQLPSLAAAHPEAYTALIDCCLRMPVLPPDSMLVPGPLLLHEPPAAWWGSQAALDNTAAVAGLASALTSLCKRAAQHIRAAADLQSQLAAAATGESDEAAAAAYFPAAAPTILFDCVTRPACLLADCLKGIETDAAGAGNAVGSGSSSQAAASAALLAVVFARSLVQLADAMEAAGSEVYLKSLLGRQVFRMRWLSDPLATSFQTDGDMFPRRHIVPHGRRDRHNAEAQWQVWQLAVLWAVQFVWAVFKSVGIAPSAAREPAAAASTHDAAAAAAAAAVSKALAGDACASPPERSASNSIGSSSNSNGSSVGQQGWQAIVLQAMQPLWAAFKSVGLAPSAAAAGEPAAATASTSTAAAAAAAAADADAGQTPAAEACADPQESSTSSNSGSV